MPLLVQPSIRSKALCHVTVSNPRAIPTLRAWPKDSRQIQLICAEGRRLHGQLSLQRQGNSTLACTSHLFQGEVRVTTTSNEAPIFNTPSNTPQTP